MSKTLYFISILTGMFLLVSFSGGPPTGRTGAPGEGLCTGCHGGGNPQGLNGTVTVNGVPSMMTGGTTYPISVTVTNPNGISQGAGFQMTILNSINQKIGTMSGAGGGSKVHPGGAREYHDHTARKSYSGGAATWTVNWIAPMVIMDTDVTFWAAGNITDKDVGVNSSNDLIVTFSVTGTIMGTGTPLSVNVVATDVTCNGGIDGSATAVAMGGMPPHTYKWSNGSSGPSIMNLKARNYTVTVTDVNQNTATVQTQVNEPDPTIINLISKIDVDCTGNSTGSAMVQATGNNGGFSYRWSNAQQGSSVGNLKAGRYTVTATDSKNCKETLRVIIDEPDELNPNVILSHVNCHNDSSGQAEIKPLGGVGPFDFNWSDGFTELGDSSKRTDLISMDYKVIISDMNGCVDSVEFTLEMNTGIDILVDSIRNNPCAGDSSGYISLSIAGDQKNVSIEWNTGDTAKTLTQLRGGIYTAVFTDSLGCMDSVIIDLNDPSVLGVSDVVINHVNCPGDSSGNISIIAIGGSGNIQIDWSNGKSGKDVTGLTEGPITVTLTDKNNCTIDSTFEIIHNDTIAPILRIKDRNVYVDENGIALISSDYFNDGSTDNCTDSLEFRILQDSFDCADIEVSIEVIVFAIDDAGNDYFDTAIATIIDTFPPILSCHSDTVTSSCSFTYDSLSASDNCGIVETRIVQGPNPGEIFSTGLTMVVYEVKDRGGNVSTCTFMVEITNDLKLSSNLVSIAMCPGNESLYTFNSSGGSGIYTVIINGIDTIIADSANTYSYSSSEKFDIMLIDDSGCQFTIDSLGLDLKSLVVDSSSVIQMTGMGANNGSVTIFVSGGTAPYTYSWIDTTGMSLGTQSTESNLGPGGYICRILDSNDCLITTDTFYIELFTATIDIYQESIVLFPNPAVDYVTIESPFGLPDKTTLYNLSGKVIIQSSKVDQLDISQISPGLYFVLIKVDGYQIIKKMIVE